jgi:DGQHR domain-containing protein
VYLFSLTGRELLEVADVSRVSRNDLGALLGYQRAEVKRHVKDIINYLNGTAVVFPNSIILALSSRTRFIVTKAPVERDGLVELGTLQIPLSLRNGHRAAWIVDGQQRALALYKSRKAEFAIPVSAFITDDLELQRDQFLRINNTRPLPRGLLTELLPTISAPLPTKLESKRLPAVICELLSNTETSPFFNLVRRASHSKELNARAVIADTSLVKMLSESITNPAGCLFPYNIDQAGSFDLETALLVLLMYWDTVRQVFPDAWGLPPTASRLMHGAGIRAMGRLMDRVMATIDPKHPEAHRAVLRAVHSIAPACRWTSGRWDELGGMAWNELQNVPRHIDLLSNLLIRAYIQNRGV